MKLYWDHNYYQPWTDNKENHAKDKSWHSRQHARIIERMYFVSPSKGE